MEQLFRTIEEEIPGYLAAAAGSLDGAGFSTHSAGDLDLAEGREPFLQMIRSYDALYRAMGGAIDLGSNDEVLITASRVYLLIKVDHGAQRFVAVLLGSSGNIGYLRFRMRDYLRGLGRA